METGKNQSYNRGKNNILVINYLRQHGSASATKLAEEFSLSNAALSSILKNLAEKGIIRESVKRSVRGKGRKQVNYVLNDRFALIALINIEYGRYHIVFSNIKEEILIDELFYISHYTANTYEAIASEIARLLRLDEFHGVPLKQIVIAVAGLVNVKYSKIHSYLLEDSFFEGRKWIDKLKRRFGGCDVTIGNDMNLAMYGEIQYGAAKDKGAAILVSNESTIGGAIAMNKRVFVGEDGYAGEFGTMPAFFDGRMIPLFYFASIQGLEYHFKTKGFDSILKLYRENQEAREYVLSTAKAMGETLYSISRLLNISSLILVGKATQFGEDYLAAIQNQCNDPEFKITTVTSKLGIQAVTLGAFYVAVSALLARETETSNTLRPRIRSKSKRAAIE